LLIPYLQDQRTHIRMIATGKRRRLKIDNRMAPQLAIPRYTAKVNATVPERLRKSQAVQ
jgi:hypothetical protein